MGVVVNSGGKEIPISNYFMKRRHEQAEICSIFEVLTHKPSRSLSTENRAIMHYSRYVLQELGHFMDDSYTFSIDDKIGIVSPSFDEEILAFSSFEMVDPNGLLDKDGRVIDKDISKLVEIYKSGEEVKYTPGEFLGVVSTLHLLEHHYGIYDDRVFGMLETNSPFKDHYSNLMARKKQKTLFK